MSLKSELQKIIRERGYMSTAQVEEYCKAHRYKLSNAERRLRESESPNVEAVKEKGYIIGYKPKRNPFNGEQGFSRATIEAINQMHPFKETPKKPEPQKLL